MPERSHFRTALRLSFIGLGARVAVTGFALLNTVLLARWLGPTGYGTYVIFVRSLSLLTMAGDLGQAQSATAFFGADAHRGSHLYRAFLRIVAATSLVTTAVAAAVLWLWSEALLPGFPRQWLWLICASLPASIYGNFWFGMMIGRGEIWRLNVLRVVSSALYLLYTLVFVGMLSGGLEQAIVGFAVVTGVQMMVMLALATRLDAGTRRDGSPPPRAGELAGFGLRAYGNVVFYTIWTSAPLFVLNAFHGAAAVGVFSIGQQIVDKLVLPVQAMQEAVYRQMGNLTSSAAAALMNRYVSVIFWGACLAVLIGVPAAAWGVPLLLGAEYTMAALLTGLLLVGAPFMTVMMILDPYFVTSLRRPGLASTLAAGNALVVALLALLLIPSLSAYGAVAAQVLTQCVGAVVALALYTRTSDSGWRRVMWAGRHDLARIRARTAAMVSWKSSGV